MRENPFMPLHLATTSAANEFLAEDPLALLVGMLLDQRVPSLRNNDV
jgi:hypothetical protein